jgi:hypothetical protein
MGNFPMLEVPLSKSSGRIPKWMDAVRLLPIALREQEGIWNLMTDYAV